jgi:hypothetical protein
MEMKKRGSTLYCFSPPVMLATFTIEVILFVYTLIRYKINILSSLIAAILALLATFQLAEYQVCGHSEGVSAASRVGFIAITMLPPIGLHIISRVTRKIPPAIVAVAYASGLSFAFIFGLGKTSFSGHVCAGNYAIFQLAPHLGGAFFTYYYCLLSVGILVALYSMVGSTEQTRQILSYFIFGYLVLLIPTGMINALNPRTVDGIPSVMCGFAIVYALVLAFGVEPLALKRRK